MAALHHARILETRLAHLHMDWNQCMMEMKEDGTQCIIMLHHSPLVGMKPFGREREWKAQIAMKNGENGRWDGLGGWNGTNLHGE